VQTNVLALSLTYFGYLLACLVTVTYKNPVIKSIHKRRNVWLGPAVIL